ncbi:MAG: DUF421 domain-containing protein [Actinomycetota bacterium]
MRAKKSRVSTRPGLVGGLESGYALRVMYASVSRPGLVTPWSVEVRRPGGFMGPVTLAASSSYLEIFDGNGFGPDPSSVGTLGFWILVSSYLSFRWKRIRGLVEGIPTIVVRDGRISEEVLKVERLGEEEVLGAAREQGIASLSEIRFGILEGDGKFSFIKVHRDDQPGGAEKRSR